MPETTVRIEISHDPEGAHHPLAATHHWHGRAWVDEINVADVWCATSAIALDEVSILVERAGVATVIPDDV